MSSTSEAEPAARRSVKESLYRHAATVRLAHWVNVLALLVLLMSGLQIFNAHPALDLGSTSFDRTILSMDAVMGDDGQVHGITTLFGHKFDTTGWFGAGNDGQGGYERFGFPWSVTLPGYRFLALGRHWHFFFAWVFVINGLIYLAYIFASGHLRRDLAPDKAQLKGIGKSIKDHALFRFDHGEEARRYNVLQKLSYLAVIFILLPLMLGTGLTMSPGMDAAFPWLLDLFGGRQSARTIHFVSASLIVLFVLVHVFMVFATGLWNNMRSMITGRYVIETEAPK